MDDEIVVSAADAAEGSKPKILIVDDSEMNRFILTDILGDEYEIFQAENGVEAVNMLKQHMHEIELVMLDMVMPDMDGFDVLAVMNKYHWIDTIPVIMISVENSPTYVERAYELGVTEYINRPFDAMTVRRRAANTIMLYAKQRKLIGLVADQVYEKEKSNNLMISILSHIVEFRNGESGLHVLHIHAITEILLNQLARMCPEINLSYSDIARISTASALHDIGKISIPAEILNKPGRLTDDEFEIMKTHSQIGADMLAALPFMDDEPLVKVAYEICRWHHERYDGRGYPDGLKGDEIPISAQVVSVADVYDALTSERVYKKAFSHEKAMQMIIDGECGTFNPLILKCLNEVADKIREELKVSSLSRYDYRAMQGITNEILRKENVGGGEYAIDLERKKLNFLTSISDELMFEYIADPPMIMFFGNKAAKLGLGESVVDPIHNNQVIEIMPAEEMQKFSETVRTTTPENPRFDYECDITFEGKKRKALFRCCSMWTADNDANYIGVVGKISIL